MSRTRKVELLLDEVISVIKQQGSIRLQEKEILDSKIKEINELFTTYEEGSYMPKVLVYQYGEI